MGVWIEIYFDILNLVKNIVTPCVGVWIEISTAFCVTMYLVVTPCVGVWIEIPFAHYVAFSDTGHSLRGSVD